jgi:hypothetical protein
VVDSTQTSCAGDSMEDIAEWSARLDIAAGLARDEARGAVDAARHVVAQDGASGKEEDLSAVFREKAGWFDQQWDVTRVGARTGRQWFVLRPDALYHYDNPEQVQGAAARQKGS